MQNIEKTLIIDPIEDIEKIKALASEPRVKILNLLRNTVLNVNEVADTLNLPQSTVATHISILENAGLVCTESIKAKKGNQKKCYPSFNEILIKFQDKSDKLHESIDVEMPVGIFTDYYVSSPCGLCSLDRIIGYLDTPDSFLNPERMKAGLLWCGSGFFEYKFPNNAIHETRPVRELSISMELSSETPGTNSDYPSDITLWLNNKEIGTWVSPGDYGDRRGKYTPLWWKLEGSQYGLLKKWSITNEGSFINDEKISDIKLSDLELNEHHSIRVKVGVKENAEHAGGMNIFGRGFGDHDQGIILSLRF